MMDERSRITFARGRTVMAWIGLRRERCQDGRLRRRATPTTMEICTNLGHSAGDLEGERGGAGVCVKSLQEKERGIAGPSVRQPASQPASHLGRDIWRPWRDTSNGSSPRVRVFFSSTPLRSRILRVRSLNSWEKPSCGLLHEPIPHAKSSFYSALRWPCSAAETFMPPALRPCSFV